MSRFLSNSGIVYASHKENLPIRGLLRDVGVGNLNVVKDGDDQFSF